MCSRSLSEEAPPERRIECFSQFKVPVACDIHHAVPPQQHLDRGRPIGCKQQHMPMSAGPHGKSMQHAWKLSCMTAQAARATSGMRTFKVLVLLAEAPLDQVGPGDDDHLVADEPCLVHAPIDGSPLC